MAEELWTAELLDSSDRKLCDLPRVRGGKLDWSIFRSVQGGGSLDITDGAVPVTPNWLSDRIKVWHTDRFGVVRPMGVWLATRPGRDVIFPGLEHSTLTLSDKTQLLNQKCGAWLTYPAGTVVTTAVIAIVLGRGEARANVTRSTETLRAAVTYQPTDTWLTVANGLLAAIGHTSLAADMNGVLGAAPYAAPADRPVVARYGAGQSKMLPGYSNEADIASIPNRVVVTAGGDETTAGLIGEASNDDPADPLSTVNRPEVVATEEVDEATSQTAINAIAVSRLHELQSVTRKATITHPVDGVQMNDMVRVDPEGFAGAVVQRSVSLDLGAVVEDTVRWIYTGGALPW